MNEIITTISNERPADISMDYERLREEGIRHLERLATEIWTDFNAHDPGITILEVLCYAITDLGYRTNFPIEDLLATRNGNLGATFYQPDQALLCHPVTADDYRKLLIDLPGVKNAWMKKAIGAEMPMFVLKYLVFEEISEVKAKELAESYVPADTQERDEKVSKLKTLIQSLVENPNRIGDIRTMYSALADELIKDFRAYKYTFFKPISEEEAKKLAEKYGPKKPENPNEIEAWSVEIEMLTNLIFGLYGNPILINKIQKSYSSLANTLLCSYGYLKTTTSISFNNFIIPDTYLKTNYNINDIEKVKALIAELKTKPENLLKIQAISFKLAQHIGETYAKREKLTISFAVDIEESDIDRYINDEIKKQVVKQLIIDLKRNKPEAIDKIRIISNDFANYIQKLNYELEFTPELFNLNGLYNIQLELDDAILPNDIRKIEEIKGNVLARLQTNRNLCEDFLNISIVKNQYICICLNIEVAPEANEAQVLAEALFRLQEFLAPTVRSYSFQQMLEKGYHCEDIFDGPLLENGFIDFQELEQANLRQKIYLSDLHRIIVETPYVEVIKEFKIRTESTGGYTQDWCYDVKADHKWVIDLCCSKFHVSKGPLTCTIDDDVLQEPLEILRLSYQNLLDTSLRHPTLKPGIYREDLAEYVSVQYEFPDTYAVGDNKLPEQASPLRKAQSKQLQAYLLFYDQILAAYLAQLAQVRDLLSVQQDYQTPTRFYQTLLTVPGIRELITTDFKVYEITEAGIKTLETKGVSAATITALRTKLGARILSHKDFEAIMRLVDESLWEQEQNFLITLFQQNPSDEDWEHYIQKHGRDFIEKLEALHESPYVQRRRKNQVYDHLLARFGEQFSEYVARLQCGKKSCGTAGVDIAELKAKANFLAHLPALQSERGQGYNYRARTDDGRLDVWNTDNVAGVKKRVYSLLGIENPKTESLICDPDYILDIEQGETRDGLPTYQLHLKDRNTGYILLSSTKYRKKRVVEDLREEIYKIAWKKEYYIPEPANDKFKIVFKNPSDSGKNLSSPALPEPDANRLLRRIVNLISDDCTKEGFHLIEHILLRPNDQDDDLFTLSLSCDENNPVRDPYSFWLTVLVPNWTERFQDTEYRYYFEQLFRRETPAHIAVRFCWVSREQIYEIEPVLKRWVEEKARCTPNECHVTQYANQLIGILNAMNCSCYCETPEDANLKCENTVTTGRNYRMTTRGISIPKA